MLKAEISCWDLREIAKTNPERYAELRKIQPNLIEDPEENYQEFKAYINDIEMLPDWLIEKAKFKPIKPLKIMMNQPLKSENIAAAIQSYQVYLPSDRTLEIRELQVLEDACTDGVNKELQDGWCILCVLPQPGSRRPDYILGKR